MRTRRTPPLRFKVLEPLLGQEEMDAADGGDEACRDLSVARFRVFGILLPEQGDRLAARVAAAPGIEAAQLDFVAQVLRVEYLPGTVDAAGIQRLLRELGVEAGPALADDGLAESLRKVDWDWAVWVGLLGIAVLGLWILPEVWGSWSRVERTLLAVGEFVASSLGLMVAGSKLRANLKSELRTATLSGCSFLLVVAGALYVLSVLQFVSGSAPQFHLAGQALLMLALWWLVDVFVRQHSYRHVRHVEGVLPATALVKRRGNYFHVPWNDLQPDDEVRAAEGGRVPLDATVWSGGATCGAAFPQSRVQEVGPGQIVWAGTVVESGSLVLHGEHARPRRAVATELRSVSTAARATQVPGDWVRQKVEHYGAWVAVALGLAGLALWNTHFFESRDGVELFVTFLLCLPFPVYQDLRDLAVRTTMTGLLIRRVVVLRPDLLVRLWRRRLFVVVDGSKVSSEVVAQLGRRHHLLSHREVTIWIGDPEQVPPELSKRVLAVSGAHEAAEAVLGRVRSGKRYVVLTDIETARRMDLKDATHLISDAFWGERFGGEVAARLVDLPLTQAPVVLSAIRNMRRGLAVGTWVLALVAPLALWIYLTDPTVTPLWVAGITYGTAVFVKLLAASR